MKKFLQVSIVVFLVIAVAASILTAIGTHSSVAGKTICNSVGWNSRITSCHVSSPLPDIPGLTYKSAPGQTPDVGWNT